MGRNVFVTLLETIVFAHKVQVITSQNDCARHFCFNDDSGQDASSDRHVAGERTLLVDVRALDGL